MAIPSGRSLQRYNKALFWAFCTREFLQPISSLKPAPLSRFPSSLHPPALPSPQSDPPPMSDSPEDTRAASEDPKVDEIEDSAGGADTGPFTSSSVPFCILIGQAPYSPSPLILRSVGTQPDPPPKRKRGRPPGSKNKKTLAAEASAAAAGPSTDSPRKRGRPPKVRTPIPLFALQTAL